jgi:esterase/lipase
MQLPSQFNKSTLISLSKGLAKLIGVLLFIALLVLALLAFLPAPQFDTSMPDRMSYADAQSKIESVQDRDTDEINKVCHTRSFDHGEQTETAVILFHGFTNCPQQYEQLGQQLFEMGYNVYIPRTPRHGFADVLTEQPKDLTPQELIKFTQESVEIASGLGQSVHVSGISGGANLAAWAAYYSPVVDQALLSSPLLTPQEYPTWQQGFIINTMGVLPNQFHWWEEENKDLRTEGPMHAYPRFSTKALRSFIALSPDLRSDLKANTVSQEGKVITVTFVDPDPAVNNDSTREYMEWWEASGAEVSEFTFDPELGLEHDYVDPDQSFARPDDVYPILVKMI